MNSPRLMRRRYIPDETVELNSDELLGWNTEIIVTRWRPIHPRPEGDFVRGVSAAYIKRGYKISALFGADGGLLRYYADIIATDHNAEDNTYTMRDLLADVVIYPDGRYTVLDLDELAAALNNGLISQYDCCFALNALNELLSSLYSNTFEALCAPLLPFFGESLLGD